jgi:hypothetical protein
MDKYHHHDCCTSIHQESQLLLLKLKRVTSYTREIEVNLPPNDKHKVYQVCSIWRKSQLIFSKLPTIRSKGFKKRPIYFDNLPVVEEVIGEDFSMECSQDIVSSFKFIEEQTHQSSNVFTSPPSSSHDFIPLKHTNSVLE